MELEWINLGFSFGVVDLGQADHVVRSRYLTCLPVVFPNGRLTFLWAELKFFATRIGHRATAAGKRWSAPYRVFIVRI